MLKELIDKFYLDRERSKSREQIRFYITDAGRCGRAVFFKFKKVPREEMEARVLRMFDHGDAIHRFILSTLYSLGLVRASEINIPPQQIISGRADAIITLEKEDCVLDIKSMNSMVFKNLESPKEENVDQIQLYLHFFRKEKGILLYVNKDTLELKEFLVGYDRRRAESLLTQLEQLKKKIDGNVIPDRIPGYPNDWQCKYCPFREVCSLSGAGEVSWEEFKKKMGSKEDST